MRLKVPGYTAPLVIMVGALSGDIPLFLASYVMALVLSLWSNRTGVAVALSATVIGFISEVVGVRTGVPFGPYKYTGTLGLEFLSVPIAVVVVWGAFTLVSFSAVRSFPTSTFMRSLLGAILNTVLDLSIDPIMVKAGFWEWGTVPGPSWFGIPWTNYLGWFIVSFTSIDLAEVIFKGGERDWRGAYALLYLLSYYVFVLRLDLFPRPELEEALHFALAVSTVTVTSILVVNILLQLSRVRPQPP